MTLSADEAYAAWKGWGNPAYYGPGERRIWDTLHRIIGLKSGDRVLEIGFGQGSHLHYCAVKGIIGTGLEQNEAGHRIARLAGLHVFRGTLADLPPSGSYNAIMAFDVIEHVPISELIVMMQEFKRLLSPGGKILLAFPNGASPFGRLHQHGDITHVNAFNRSSIEQLAILTGYRLIHFSDYPEYFSGGISNYVKRPLRALMRSLIKCVVSSYFKEPLGLSVVAVLEQSKMNGSLSQNT